ncbi:MAG TPA: LptE family protein [Kiritimatiellia bacterium]|nr:LptE family protein [Kiritimatiellia bacterium]HSA19060.1 LptE family protein [Kiritimatiellia bacterium]
MTRTAERRNVAALGLAALALVLPGCVGYKLGSMLPADIKTVYVEPFINQTDEPLIEVEVTRAAVGEIQRDGSLRIVRDPAAADAVLKVALTSYTLSPIAYQADRATATEEYKLELAASARLTRRASGAVVVDTPRITGETTFILAGDLTTSKEAGLPAAAQDLGRRIVASLVEAWP